ncbi:MAG: hypothetical protein EBX41_02045 [Chitinophagia bacterium]|nr:hypothetical protein [Chitinophagia bacterium]
MTGQDFKQLIKQYELDLTVVGEAFGKPTEIARQYAYSLYQRDSFRDFELDIIRKLIVQEKGESALTPQTFSLIQGSDIAELYTYEMPVLDEAMQPEYQAGSSLLVKQLQDAYIANGYAYVIATSEQVFIRKWYYNKDSATYTGYAVNNLTYMDGDLAGKPVFEPVVIPQALVLHIYAILEYRKPEQHQTISLIRKWLHKGRYSDNIQPAYLP